MEIGVDTNPEGSPFASARHLQKIPDGMAPSNSWHSWTSLPKKKHHSFSVVNFYFLIFREKKEEEMNYLKAF